MLSYVFAVVCLALWLAHAFEVFKIVRVVRLSDVPIVDRVLMLLTKVDLPTLSIVIAARNEEKTLPGALKTVLDMRYPGLQVVVVNDRSDDRTGAILDEFAATHSNLKAVHVKELPKGWLGKVNAMNLGAMEVTTKWMLFTDADIHFEPYALIRAVNLAEQSNVDHLAILPQMEEHNALLGIVLATTMTIFMMFVRPWKIRQSPSHYAGVGAFNMIKTESYRAYGGHSKIRMRPDDDMMLGKLVKKMGGSSEYAFSDDLIHFSWYESIGELITGLSKNMYASLEYSLAITLTAALMHLVMFVWPLIAVMVYADDLLLSGIYLTALGLSWLVSFCILTSINATPYYALGTPLGAIILVYILVRTAVMTHYNGGIVWRGTVYSLEELRRNVI